MKWTARQCNLQTALEVTADLAAEHTLSFANSIIYATAKFHNALLITSDAHFEELPGVKFFKMQSGRL